MVRTPTQKQLAALAVYQYPPGTSGNAGGKPKSKPLTEGMRLLLAGDVEGFMQLPKPLKLIIGRWYGQAWSSPHGMALLLERIEGKVPQTLEHRELPSVQFVMQMIKEPSKGLSTSSGSGPDSTTLKGAAAPSQESNGRNGHARPQVEEVEAVPVDDEDEEEEQD